jgi:UDP-2,4-diacetamido-2,4,6-trideoxy-beta-L-altropyranose hydrolase
VTRLAIRVDASAQMGIGHVKRCLALATAWRAGGLGEVTFVTRAFGDVAETLIARAGLFVRRLPAPTGEPVGSTLHAAWAGVEADVDAAQTLEALEGWDPAVVLVDHYAFGATWHDRVRAGTGAAIAAIDDLGDRAMAVDFLIDHNLAADHRLKYQGRLRAKTRLLAGPRLALLDPLYALAPKAVLRDTVASIGIFMGGADAAGATPRVIEACRKYAAFAGPIEVASTSANPALDELRAACARWPQTTLTLDLDHLAGFFARHDLHIGAGGGASWERCCIGVPTLALACADNQTEVVRELVRRGVAACAASLELAAIGAALSALLDDAGARRRLHERASDLVDGRGAQRVALALAAPALVLRNATEMDAVPAYAWRNDPRTRALFNDNLALDLEAHLAWWRHALRDRRRTLLVAHCGALAVGVIRFDVEADAWCVSLYLNPEWTGLGLGHAILAAGVRWVSSHADGPKALRAHVHPENAASQATFSGAGFRQVTATEWQCTIPT